MVALHKHSLAAVTNEPLKVGTWSSMQRYDTNVPTNVELKTLCWVNNYKHGDAAKLEGYIHKFHIQRIIT